MPPTAVQHFIQGRYVDSPTAQVMDVTTPHTNEVIARVPLGTVADVTAAVDSAHAAFTGVWSAKTIK